LSVVNIPKEIQKKRPWKLSSDWARRFAAILYDRLVEQNRNFLVVFVGETGTGKSYSAIAMAEMIDPDFTIEKVVYEPKDFLNLLDKCGRGEVIVFDEAGVGIPAREWQSIQNKLMGYVLQTFRYKNIGVFFTTPSLAFIDKQVKILTHFVVKVYGHMNNQTKCVVYEKNHDPVRDITEWSPWIFVDRERGIEYDPNPIYIGAPSEDLVEQYEKLSQERKAKVYRDAFEHIKALEEGIKTEGFDGRTIRRLKNIAVAFYGMYRIVKDELGYSYREIASRIGVDHVSLRNWVNWVEQNIKLLKPELVND